MASGNITGKVNIPTVSSPVYYTGLDSNTASTVIDNEERTIKVEANVEEITKDCAKKSDIPEPYISGINLIGMSQLSLDGANGAVSFIFDEAVFERLNACKFIVFTMNNSFIMTPLAQTGETLSCGSFAFDSNGNTVIARVRISKGHAYETDNYYLRVSFNTEFCELAGEGFTSLPYAMLLIAE